MGLLQKHLSKLKNKTAWITGGKRIGQTVAKALAELGVNLVVSYRSSKEEADQTVAEVKKLGVKAIAVQANVSNRESVKQAVEEIASRFRRLDILVNMASVFNSIEFDKITRSDWDDNINAHIFGSFWPIQLAAPSMPKGGHIINIADRTSIGRSYKNYLPYIVTKKAVEGITKAAAKELAGQGIYVNAIAPGPILPPESTSKKEWAALRNSSPIKFPITDTEAVDQFALLVLYLCVVTMTSGCVYSLDQGQNL